MTIMAGLVSWQLLAYFATLISIILARYMLASYREYQSDMAMGAAHGCLAPARLINEKPLGLDRLHQIWEANTESRLMELFLWHFRRWGNTLEQVFLGTKAFGSIDPLNLQTILATKFEDWGFGLRRNIMFPLFGDGIFTQEGPAWKHSREQLRPQFTYKQYEDLEVFRQHVENLMEVMATHESGVIDLQPLFFRLTLDTTSAFLFGESVYSLKSGGTETNFEESFNTAQSYVAMRFRLLDLYWLIRGKTFDNACKSIHQFADEILDRNLHSTRNDEKADNRYIFLDALARDYPDRTALRQQMMNILFAGRDTTACLLSWTFYLLIRHTRVLDKVRVEIASIIGNKPDIERSDLKKLVYLNNVLKETLRLYPSVPVNQRCAIRTTILPTGGGPDGKAPVLVRRGATLAYSVYSLHRRADLYGEDCEDFRPERWEEDLGLYRDEVTKTWGYLPFNGGPRICLGMDFALTEAAYTAVRILQRFPTLKIPENETVVKTGKEKQTITLVIAVGDGCNVLLK